MEWFSVGGIVLILYAVGAILLTVYTVGEFHLLYYYLTRRRRTAGYVPPVPLSEGELPRVTVQVPMYNELYVAEHVIDACARLDYPRDRLEIHILDDSTDESLDVARRRVAYWQDQGVDIHHIHRVQRHGYKAGALADATPRATGEFLALFDADFRPHPDFLRRLLPHFRDPGIGFVQARWGHLNRRYSMLTYVQSLLIDMFFVIEQQARAVAGFFIRFNGSAGIWRRRCLEDAGGWTPDTLAEDLDLCFRAQLRGWRGVYDGDVLAPAEVPVTMHDFKTQQYRWTKGKAQVVRKHLGAVLRARLSPLVKLHALFDLLNIVATPGILLLSTFSVPLTWLVVRDPVYGRYLLWISFGLVNALVAPWFVLVVLRTWESTWRRVAVEFLRVFPPLVATIVGMPVFQVWAMLDGFLGGKATFHKTAKYNITRRADRWRDKIYSPREISPTTYLEGLLSVLFVSAVAMGVLIGNLGALPFHVILSIGYGYVFTRSVVRA